MSALESQIRAADKARFDMGLHITGVQEAVESLRREGKISTAGNSTGHREEKPYRFDLLPYEGLRAAAETFAYGEKKYGRLKPDNLEPNWHGLDITTHQSPLSHAMEHLAKHVTGDRSEDHLGHALANVMMQCWFERSPGSKYCGLTYPEILAGRTAARYNSDPTRKVINE